VDGFRVDVAHGLAKEPGLPDLPEDVLRMLHAGAAEHPETDFRWDRDAVHQYHRAMRHVLDSYPDDRMAVGEIWVEPERLALYVRPDEFNLAFNFELLEVDWGAEHFRAAITRSMQALADVGATATWVLANHDVDRAATRYGSVERARAAALMMLSLPGAAYIYNGDELGLANVELPDEVLQDPTWERSGHTERGRDGERVPLPWSGNAAPFGFSSGTSTWLPQPAEWSELTAEKQAADPSSTLALYRNALRLRRDLVHEPFGWLEAPDGCLAYSRGPVSILINTGARPVTLPEGEVLLASGPVSGELPPNTSVWLR
jgi:alpha-glucosidase